MASYVLSTNAQRSLKGIGAWSLEKLGRHQTTLYLKKLRDRMQYLADHQHCGIHRDDIKDGYYSHFEGSHTIYYYRIEANTIGIIDVLHQSMDPQRHLLESRQSLHDLI